MLKTKGQDPVAIELKDVDVPDSHQRAVWPDKFVQWSSNCAWSQTSDAVRMCVDCLDPIPEGSLAVHRWGDPTFEQSIHPRCVTDWHEWLGPVMGGDSSIMSKLRSSYTADAKRSIKQMEKDDDDSTTQ